MMTRRTLLKSASAAALPGLGCSTTPPSPMAGVMARCAEEMLEEHPQSATSMGLDTGARAALRSRLDDCSLAGLAAQHGRCRKRLALLEAIDARGLAIDERLSLDTVIHAHRLGVEGSRFETGHHTLQGAMNQSATPYAVTQMTGAFAELPEMLKNEHPIDTAADAQAYLARLDGFATSLDAETARLATDRSRGVVAPGFVLDIMAAQFSGALAVAPQASDLVGSLAERARAADLPHAALAAQATRLLEQRLLPALQRQLDEVRSARPAAPAEGGLGALPGGEQEYRWFLKISTASELGPDEIHRQGLALVRELEAQMDQGLRAQGRTQGSVGQRLQALSADPAQRFPNDDAGRDAAVAHANALMEKARAAMPGLSRLNLKAPAMVKRTPPALELGAANAYMYTGSMDGKRPATFYLNLHDTATWPRWTLATLAFHETLPGHVWQNAYGNEHRHWPLVRMMIRFNASSEGWALYAEQLADEMGWYADDPLGRLGYLQSMQLRAARLVVDTGLHAFGWSRERAVDEMTRATGRPRAAMVGEVNRYCIKPGQACGYMVGLQEINRLRTLARQLQGTAFSAQAFNDFFITSGNVPFFLLERALREQAA